MASYHEFGQRLHLNIIYRGCRKYFVVHIAIALGVVYLLYTIGGALVPRMPFLRIDPDISTLVYFNVNRDASKITWARSTNSRQALQKAVASNVHMIEGDVILQGQGTPHQRLVPVMGLPHEAGSDFPLEDWLDGTKYRNKGIKLDFSSIDVVEIALQRLREFSLQYPVRSPVWIHADVLSGPHGGKVMVDPSRFFRTLKREFPKCTLSLGWTTGTHTDLSQSGYSWDMVMDMYELVKKWRIDDQPIVFEARLSLIRNSVTQLKWLCDNVKNSALNIIHVERDAVLSEDLMYIAYRFPQEGVFFDLNHKPFEKMLAKYRHFSQEKVSHLVSQRDEVMFRHKDWMKMGFYIQKDSLLPSTDSFILTTPIVYIVSKAHYSPSRHVSIQGRVKFLNRNKAGEEPFSTGLNIYTRPTSYANFEHIVGIKCFIGADGDVEVKGSDMPENIPDFRKTARMTPSAVNCFRFRVTDTGDQVIFQVSTVHDCHTLESVIPEHEEPLVLTVDIPPVLAREASPFIVRMEDNKRQAVIDELTVKHKME
ncbi:menorin-like [Babylonia areolata]|uniref:menorin-like n=1 Tax=Babylonia areolata TaxID=304850 RepID=UPI003FD1BC05